ncbi:hypothetical protein [Mycolicibacterium fluoranthenivorans]|uniref:hypothetical protein n=1 Tax=Mycolicibacterium fluoranthenivorans TaxID=258505 RepID=UPI0021F2D31D|nr:hypothetical protein [Mycolicibacterium fluoranthenivorans]
MDDYSNKDIREALKNREARQADGVTRSEIAFVALAEAAVACWTEWCEVPGGIKIEQRLDRKFRLCFPLCANAINHVEAALAMRSRYPWVAKASARIAFEHALTAQWVLLTVNGEYRLKAHMDYKAHKQHGRFINNIRRMGESDDSFAQVAHGLSDQRLNSLVGEAPKELGLPKLDAMCGRFAEGGATNLLYDIYSDLSGAVHPSWSLVRAHARFSSTGVMTGIQSDGSAAAGELLGCELALSALWALYVVEVCRPQQLRGVQVVKMGESAGLPVDLRASDHDPSEQPSDTSAYWLPVD